MASIVCVIFSTLCPVAGEGADCSIQAWGWGTIACEECKLRVREVKDSLMRYLSGGYSVAAGFRAKPPGAMKNLQQRGGL